MARFLLCLTCFRARLRQYSDTPRVRFSWALQWVPTVHQSCVHHTGAEQSISLVCTPRFAGSSCEFTSPLMLCPSFLLLCVGDQCLAQARHLPTRLVYPGSTHESSRNEARGFPTVLANETCSKTGAIGHRNDYGPVSQRARLFRYSASS